MGETFEYFVCTCKEDGKAEAKALLEGVYARLGAGSANLSSRSVTASNFLTMVVTSLNWDFEAHITWIASDQWSAIEAETYAKDSENNPVFRTLIECDQVEDGLAATWKAFADRFPEQLNKGH